MKNRYGDCFVPRNDHLSKPYCPIIHCIKTAFPYEYEALTEGEPEAKKNGRIAGQVASIIVVVGGSIAAVTVGGSAAVAAAVLGIAIGLGAYHLLKGE